MKFTEKMQIKKIKEDIFKGTAGYYRLTCWETDFRDPEVPEESLSEISPQNLPQEGEVKTFKTAGYPSFSNYVTVRRIPDGDVEELRRRVEACLQRGDLASLLDAGREATLFTRYPHLWG